MSTLIWCRIYEVLYEVAEFRRFQEALVAIITSVLYFKHVCGQVIVKVTIIADCQEEAKNAHEKRLHAADIRQHIENGVPCAYLSDIVEVHLDRNVHLYVVILLIRALWHLFKNKERVVFDLCQIVQINRSVLKEKMRLGNSERYLLPHLRVHINPVDLRFALNAIMRVLTRVEPLLVVEDEQQLVSEEGRDLLF